MMSTQIHPGWLRPFDPARWKAKRSWIPEKANRKLEPRLCSECKRGYMPEVDSQETCGSERCIRLRSNRLKRESRAA